MSNPLPSYPEFVPGRGVAVDLSSVDFTGSFGSLWIGGAGSGALEIVGLDGVNVTYTGVGVGRFIHAGKGIIKAGTTVTGIVAQN